MGYIINEYDKITGKVFICVSDIIVEFPKWDANKYFSSYFVIFIYDISQEEVKEACDTKAIEEAEEFAMAPMQLACPMGSAACGYKTEEVEPELAMQLMDLVS